jgi:hypothetical protein
VVSANMLRFLLCGDLLIVMKIGQVSPIHDFHPD